ncbi:MAG: Gfo/Idh/MocA family oxidoreductase [Ruminococcaceae bacterium]|nr:Gfo/Idh/MocA family oxidoreductase [Oscillospiraceae bacterium]
MKKIKIAQIGINRYSHGPDVFDTLRLLSDVFDLVGYAIVEDERETCAEKIEKHYAGIPEMTLEEILNDPSIEAVTVETDEIHLTKYAQMAAEAGKHIHMEKPGSQDLAAFEKLIETVKKSEKIFHVGYMFRYNPMIADTVRRARSGEFGHVYSVEAHMSRLDDRVTREWFGSFRGGMMFYLGCHLIDLVLQIQGEPTKIIPCNTRTGIDGVQTEDLGFAVLQYPNGVSVVRVGGTEVGGGHRRQLVVCGEHRTVEIRPLECAAKNAIGPYMIYTKNIELYRDKDGRTVKEEHRSEEFQRYEGMLRAFGEMVRGDKENPYSYNYELRLYKTILKACGEGEA